MGQHPGRPSYLFDSRLKISPNKRTVQFGLAAHRDMTNQFARAFENSVRVGKQRAAVETEVHVIEIGDNMAKAVLKRFAGEGESDRDSVTFDDGLDRVGRLSQNHITQRQSQI